MPCLGKQPALIQPSFDPTTKTGKRLMLGNYLDAQSLPTVRDSVDWTGGITDWGYHLNDKIGCCVVAGAANAVQSTTKCSTGIERSVPDSVVLADYEVNSGYIPGNQVTDTGLVVVSWLDWWRKNGFSGNILAAYADPILSNQDALEFKLAIQLFGGNFVGVQLTQADMDNFDANLPFTYSTNSGAPVGGHLMWTCIFNSQGPVFQTWKRNQQATWEWLFHRQDEIHTPLLPDWLNKDGKNPDGILFDALNMDLQLVTA